MGTHCSARLGTFHHQCVYGGVGFVADCGGSSVADILKELKEAQLKLELDASDVRFATGGDRVKSAGEHVVELQAAPGTWVPITVTVVAA